MLTLPNATVLCSGTNQILSNVGIHMASMSARRQNRLQMKASGFARKQVEAATKHRHKPSHYKMSNSNKTKRYI